MIDSRPATTRRTLMAARTGCAWMRDRLLGRDRKAAGKWTPRGDHDRGDHDWGPCSAATVA
ncbi:hypothetical protein K227x_47910 [Rubripirellula lacrimiformis]|uniref:Uncharacterized protein n=1 Tax=Rubripirellula lacrimiformis TaxID=1930273 RepID=A0A517NGX4_9BACT|nr:hypothetical protein [Rubripirellula lacrimiformis]QDT06382.1 hypothetical protein K227x_47910 [Rubripirellula lacrimiformis]